MNTSKLTPPNCSERVQSYVRLTALLCSRWIRSKLTPPNCSEWVQSYVRLTALLYSRWICSKLTLRNCSAWVFLNAVTPQLYWVIIWCWIRSRSCWHSPNVRHDSLPMTSWSPNCVTSFNFRLSNKIENFLQTIIIRNCSKVFRHEQGNANEQVLTVKPKRMMHSWVKGLDVLPIIESIVMMLPICLAVFPEVDTQQLTWVSAPCIQFRVDTKIRNCVHNSKTQEPPSGAVCATKHS